MHILRPRDDLTAQPRQHRGQLLETDLSGGGWGGGGGQQLGVRSHNVDLQFVKVINHDASQSELEKQVNLNSCMVEC